MDGGGGARLDLLDLVERLVGAALLDEHREHRYLDCNQREWAVLEFSGREVLGVVAASFPVLVCFLERDAMSGPVQ